MADNGKESELIHVDRERSSMSSVYDLSSVWLATNANLKRSNISADSLVEPVTNLTRYENHGMKFATKTDHDYFFFLFFFIISYRHKTIIYKWTFTIWNQFHRKIFHNENLVSDKTSPLDTSARYRVILYAFGMKSCCFFFLFFFSCY